LPSAKLCYVAHIGYNDGFLFIHQYKGTVGTFMSVSKFLDPSHQINVVTFVRLGEGIQTFADIYKPIHVNPFVVALDLGFGRYRVPQFLSNQVFSWTESWAQSQFYTTQTAAAAGAAKCAGLDHTARTSYPQYLNGAAIISSTHADYETAGCYCVNTYVNKQGIWEVIGGFDGSGIQINTFVRLGDGYDPANVQPCNPLPSINAWLF
jgi:hypothetical protein